MATYLTRERFKTLPPPKTQEVEIADWESIALVRGMSASVAMDILAFAGEGKADDILKVPGLITRIVIDCVVDENGKRVFTDADFDELDGQPVQALMPIVMAAIDLTDFGGRTTKNSGTGQSAGSSSDSPSRSAGQSKNSKAA